MSWKSAQWWPSCSMLTDGRTDVTKLTVALRDFANAPTKGQKCSWPSAHHEGVMGKKSYNISTRSLPRYWRPLSSLPQFRPPPPPHLLRISVCLLHVWYVCTSSWGLRFPGDVTLSVGDRFAMFQGSMGGLVVCFVFLFLCIELWSYSLTIYNHLIFLYRHMWFCFLYRQL